MSVTPNFSWPLIEPTDFVTNLPADLELLADDIDADVWAIKGTADAALPETIIDAAGDLIYGSAADTAARLAIGTAGQVLTVNSGATAPEWAAPAGGSDPYIRSFVSGEYITSPVAGTPAGASVTTNRVSYTPIYLPNCTLDRIGVYTSNFVSSGDTRLGIYTNGSDNKPNTVLLDAGTVTVTTNAAYEITINQSITAGWYWLAIVRQSGDYRFPRASSGGSYPLFSNLQTNALFEELNTVQDRKGYLQDSVTGAFATAGTLIKTGTPHLCAVRIA